MKSTSGKALTLAIATMLGAAAYAGDTEDRAHHGKMKASVEAEVRMMDTNKDGKISAAEHTAGAKQMFQGMDGNQDNRVTAVEMDAAHKPMKSTDASHGHDGHGDKQHMAEKSSAEKIKVIDTDGDGVLTAKEHEEGSKKMFSKMDTDRDGMLTAAEITAGHEKMLTVEER